MSARSFGLVSWLMFLPGCVCGTGAELNEYFCTTSEQCLPGFHCDSAKSVCVIDGANGGGAGGGAGGTGGGSDAGQDAGTDAGFDAGLDAGADAGFDAGFDAGGLVGAKCFVGADCQNGRCLDGVCCGSNCSGACDFCDLPGQEGQCRTAPLGRTPSQTCAGSFACDGVSAGCPTSCSADAGCVDARCGQGGVCVEKLVELKENFNSFTLDASTWSRVDPACTIVNSALQVVTSPNLNDYPSIRARRRYDFTDSELRLDLVDMGNQSLNSMQAIGQVCGYVDQLRCLALVVSRREVWIQLDDNRMYSGIIGYFPMNGPRAVRMRELAGTLFLDAQTDAGLWQQLGSVPTPYRTSFNDVTVDLGAGTYSPELTSTTVVWDNVNLP